MQNAPTQNLLIPLYPPTFSWGKSRKTKKRTRRKQRRGRWRRWGRRLLRV